MFQRTKNNTNIINDRVKYLKEGTVLKYEGKSQEDDYGEYMCRVGEKNQKFNVQGRTRLKLPANSNVVEGQNLRLTCKLTGKPYSTVHWFFSNETLKDVDVTELMGHRAAVNVSDQGVENGELLLQEVLRSDAGNYTCHVYTPFMENSTTTVRVKDKYAALWPFLGICIEVFVLCTIILVYEKRRTKPELDDSDTDNHDQAFQHAFESQIFGVHHHHVFMDIIQEEVVNVALQIVVRPRVRGAPQPQQAFNNISF
ncbi:Basigin [Eumeta japonica]|uniref:Basigin n=1 Tax=Eumeta variegata TaxID=151549 RepID=A0A4C1XZH5_EUMVA|nr:Basigin [Eumeta japonica]